MIGPAPRALPVPRPNPIFDCEMSHPLKRRRTKPIRWLLVAAVVCAAVHAPQAREIIGQGDFLFYLDTAAFLGADGRMLAGGQRKDPQQRDQVQRRQERLGEPCEAQRAHHGPRGQRCHRRRGRQMTFNEPKTGGARDNVCLLSDRHQALPPRPRRLSSFPMPWRISTRTQVSITGLG